MSFNGQFAEVTSPKQQPGMRRRPWYGYYAGFEPAFVSDVLKAMNLPSGAVLLDPWNGSGTTSIAAQERGVRAIGFDINPALILIARARHLPRSVAPSLRPLASEILVASSRIEAPPRQDHPLSAWLKRPAVSELDTLEQAIRLVLADASDDVSRWWDVSSLAAFFYVAAFVVVRELLAPFQSSNPTWVKTPQNPARRLNPSTQTIRSSFLGAVDHLSERLTLGDGTELLAALPRLEVADSRSLPLESGSVDGVLTSPPYCTRLDYAIAARPELAFMGFSPSGLRSLRNADFGAPVTSNHAEPTVGSDYILQLSGEISRHESKASGTYYESYFRKYFSGLSRSLGEIVRVTKVGAPIGVVVQDSSYKDIHVDLQRACVEMMASNGRDLDVRVDFRVPHSRANQNPRHRKYQTNARKATESMLVFS